MTNLVEILRNAPKGLELYSPLYGKVKFYGINTGVRTVGVEYNNTTRWFDEYGCINENSECLLFPSKENREWDNWQKTLIKVGHFIAFDSAYGTSVAKVKNIATWGKRIRFATTEEIEQWYRYRATAKTKEEPAFTIDDFKPFDKVLAKDNSPYSSWRTDIFSNYKRDPHPIYVCVAHCWRQCIPYNDETKHLLGTNEEYNGKYKTW